MSPLCVRLLKQKRTVSGLIQVKYIKIMHYKNISFHGICLYDLSVSSYDLSIFKD